MRRLPFRLLREKTDFTEIQSALPPYERLIRNALVTEDALQLIEQTRQKGYRLEPCQFDADKFDPLDICAGCPGLHVCTRRSARREAALDALLDAQLNSCYMLLYDIRVALDFRQNDTQRLYARVNVDISLYTRGSEQRKALENAMDAYQKLFRSTGEPQYHEFSRCCTHILSGDRDQARDYLRSKGVFGESPGP